ncbi:MAG TPA: Na/Pi cotransporter family protein [bacterium]|nr:Na/Pi cotransporter family protein [bacterium]
MELDWTKVIFNLIGGLGIFLYGMRMMSDGFQQVAGNKIKRIFELLTNNKIMGVFIGLSVTAIIQSSSATTVMVVGFINAGLMELSQAIGIIMGANIGTTITSWIIAIKITKFALPVLGIGVAMHLFSKNRTVVKWGQILLGFGMLFFGLKLMESAFNPLRESEDFLRFFAQFGADNTFQIIKSAFAGFVLTLIIQSSSATIGITIALANQGLLSYPAAAALVLGENIGTTITMELASIGANIVAKRAARVHTFFNLFGVTYMIFLFPFFIKFVDMIVPGNMNSTSHIAAHIAAGHSTFNICNTIIFVPLSFLLVRLATWMIPGKSDKEEKHLEFIDYNFISAPSIALGQAKKEILKMSSLVLDMFKWNGELLTHKKIDPNLTDRLFKYENITDALQAEISRFLAELLRRSPGPEDADDARCYLRIADEFESIGDYSESLAKYRLRQEDQDIVFSDDAIEGLGKAHKELYEYLELCTRCFIEEKPRVRHEADAKSKSLQKLIKKLLNDHIMRLNQSQCDVVPGLLYSDILNAFQKIRSHAHNIAEAAAGLK